MMKITTKIGGGFMAWNMKDYPASMKNLDTLVKKKAIEIANALLADDYPEDRAIPIAISQAEKWYNKASEKEKATFKQTANPQKDDTHHKDKNATKLLDADVNVKYSGDTWEVFSTGAKRASDTFEKKKMPLPVAKKLQLIRNPPYKFINKMVLYKLLMTTANNHNYLNTAYS